MVSKLPSFEFFQNIFSYSDSTHLKTSTQKFSSKNTQCLHNKLLKRIWAQYIRPTLYGFSLTVSLKKEIN
jgi:hypothetical protein